jgi:hypothetical protein
MNFPEYGSTARAFSATEFLDVLKNVNITFSEAYDIKAIFHHLSLHISKLEFKSSGNIEDINLLRNDLEVLPRFSVERLECDIRIKSLKKKWGLMNKHVVSGLIQVQYPLSLEDMDIVLFETRNIKYIDCGREGRKWIKSFLYNSQITTINSEKQLKEIILEATQRLEEIINKLINVNSESSFYNLLQKLNLSDNSSNISALYKCWESTEEKAKLKTLDQIKLLLSKYEMFILQDNPVNTTVDSNSIKYFTIK